MTKVTFKVCAETDKVSVTDFLLSIGEELYIDSRKTAEDIVHFTFARGGMVASYADDQIVGVGGYLCGDPSANFANQDIGFLYLAAVEKTYRLSRVFSRGLSFTINHLKSLGVRELRLHAREEDPYTNRLYSHFAKPLRKEPNMRGIPCILYSCLLEEGIHYTGKRYGSSRY